MLNPKIRKELENVFKLLEKKNKDYANAVYKLGKTAVIIRVLDKLYRAINIEKNSVSIESSETLDDTFRDLIGYSLIFLTMDDL